MTFKDKHALETLPKTMAALIRKPTSCRQSSTIRNSISATAPASKRSPPTLPKLQRKLAAAEEQWLELEILREELAGN